MIGLVLVMAMVVTVLGRGEEDYYNAYGFTKMMTNCFGNDLYYDYIRRVGYAKQECSQQPLAYPGQFTGSGGVQSVAPLPQQVYGYPNTPLYPNTGLYPQVFTLQQRPSVILNHRTGRQAVEPLINRDVMEASLAAVHAGISNYTCQLRVMGLIDDNLNINLNEAINQYVNIPIDSYLREDLVLSVRYCKEQSDRMPLELLTVPSPAVFRILSFAKCERKLRRFSCLKKDLRDNINLVEFSAIPDIGGAGPIDNLAIILTAAGTLDELDFF